MVIETPGEGNYQTAETDADFDGGLARVVLHGHSRLIQITAENKLRPPNDTELVP